MCLHSKSICTDIVISTSWCHEVYHLLESNQSQYSILWKFILVRNETYDKCHLWVPDRGSTGTSWRLVLSSFFSFRSLQEKLFISDQSTKSDVVRSSNICLFYVEVTRRTLDVNESCQLREHIEKIRVKKAKTFDSVHVVLFFGKSHILNFFHVVLLLYDSFCTFDECFEF